MENKTFDERVREAIDNAPKPEEPIHCFAGGHVLFLLYKAPKLELDICETYPYAPDGDVPLIFLRLGWFEFLFNNKFIYKTIYKRRYNELPEGLK